MPKFANSLSVLLMCLPSVLSAEEPDPRVQKILDSWKTQLTQMKSYRLKANVFVYDSVFQVERRADLEAAWSPAGHRIVRWTPAGIKEGEKSERSSDKGERYQLESWRRQEYWFSPAGKREIHQVIHRDEKSSSEEQGWRGLFGGIRGLLLSFGFLHPPWQIHSIDRIDWTIVSEDDETLTIHGLPRSVMEQRNFRELKVVVSKNDYSLRSIEVTNPAQTTQTLLRVVETQVDVPLNDDMPVFRIPDGGRRQVYRIPKMNGSSFGR